MATLGARLLLSFSVLPCCLYLLLYSQLCIVSLNEINGGGDDTIKYLMGEIWGEIFRIFPP